MKHPSKWLILTLLAFAQFMVVLDLSVVNVALPALHRALHFSTANLQWVVTAYALTFGGFLLLGGRAADLFGRKRTLLTGMATFITVSFLIGISRSAALVVALRALQGMAAALMSPSALSILLVTFKEGKDRNKALGIWSTVAAGGAAVGVLLGGILTQYFGWRWNFFINVPIGIAAWLAIKRIVPAHEKEETRRSLDLPGAMLATSGLMLLVYAFTQAPSWGWASRSTLSVAFGAAALLAGFVWNESRAKHPLLPLSIFSIRNVVGANLMMAPTYAGLLGTFFLVSLYEQTVLHYSPVETGLSFIVLPVVFANVAMRMSRFIGKFGYRTFLMAGPIVTASSLLLLSQLPVHGSYALHILPTLILLPIGMGMTMVSLTIAATSGVPAHQSGLASGMITTSQQMGGALGLAALSGVAASATKSAVNLSPTAAIVHGYDRAFIVAASFALFAFILAVVVIRQRSANVGTAKAIVVEA